MSNSVLRFVSRRTAQSSPLSIPSQTRYPRHVAASPLLAGNHKNWDKFYRLPVACSIDASCRGLLKSLQIVLLNLRSVLPPHRVRNFHVWGMFVSRDNAKQPVGLLNCPDVRGRGCLENFDTLLPDYTVSQISRQ